MNKTLACIFLALLTASSVYAQRPYYSGEKLSDPNKHDGGLVPIVGVHNIQIVRANRALINESDGYGWTYNHAPMLAYWGGKFWCEYLSDPRSEHVMPSHSLLCSSEDGYEWSFPKVVFPTYKIPDGTLKDGFPPSEDQYAVMHQRMGFYVSGGGRLLVLGYYGISLSPKDKPCDGKGIGRVVREIYADGTFGPVYFIHYNSAWNEKNTSYPPYTKSKDKGFVAACKEILSNPLMTNQWAEESDRGDVLITTPSVYQAMSWYHLPGDSTVVALFKNALTMTSSDEGKTWDAPAARARGFINSNAKIWGQRLSDGTFATVYNPSEFRWPLALSLSRDGVEYTTLNLVHGEVPPIRYGGHYKSYGPQYVRGIVEGNGEPPDGDLHVVYSVGKEDIWTARVPVPVRTEADSHADDDFSSYTSVSDMATWNIYSPRWAPVSIEKYNGQRTLTLKDKDPYDYAKVERIIPESEELEVEFEICPEKVGDSGLEIEFKDPEGNTCSRLEFTPDGVVRAKGGYRYGEVGRYTQGASPLKVRVSLSVSERKAVYRLDDGTPLERMFYAPVHSIARVVFRTGETRYFPTIETPTDPDDDLPSANDPAKESVWHICKLKTSSSK